MLLFLFFPCACSFAHFMLQVLHFKFLYVGIVATNRYEYYIYISNFKIIFCPRNFGINRYITIDLLIVLRNTNFYSSEYKNIYIRDEFQTRD